MPTQPITDRTALEQSLADICAKHGFTRLDIGFSGRGYNATCWWQKVSQDDCACEQGYGQTLLEALSDCLLRAAKTRRAQLPIALVDEPLPVEA